MIPVKICGITSLEDGMLVVELGASAIGFIFYEKSPRYISPQEARRISIALPAKTRKVGVFVNCDVGIINHTVDFVGLDLVQLHGDESPDLCTRVAVPVIRALRVNNSISHSDYEKYYVHAFLLDTYKHGQYGGTNTTFNWSVAKQLKTRTPFILSGGLNVDNILQGIAEARPDAVDVNSGVESHPGKKDERKLLALFDTLQKTGQYPNIFDTQTP